MAKEKELNDNTAERAERHAGNSPVKVSSHVDKDKVQAQRKKLAELYEEDKID